MLIKRPNRVRFARSVVCCGLVLLTGTALAQTRHRGTARGGDTDAASSASSDAIKNVFWQPNQLKQGSVALFTVEFTKAPLRVSGSWANRTLEFFKSQDDPKVWTALAGADLETNPGSYGLEIHATLPGGKVAKTVKQIDLAAGEFKTGTVDVPENFVEPDAEGKKEVAHDEVLKTRAYAHSAPKPLWSGSFTKAVGAPPTDTFGESRILNEEKSSLHRGTDYPVPIGTPVEVENSGVVVLATELFYEGNCVIVDHGDKFFTIYMHLSKAEVKVGDKVKKGQRIGLSGATGRVTGPHVHVGVRWNGAYLDPVQLLALTLPKTAAAEVEAKHTAARRRSR